MPTIYRNLFAMGTRFDMVLPGIDENAGDFIFTLVSKEIFRLEELLSNYVRSSTLSKLNESAFKSPFYADDELFGLMYDLKMMHLSTLGFFDVSISKLNGSGNGTPLENKQITPFSSGMNEIILNNEEKTVRFAEQGISIDSGGFGKGFALEKVKKVLLDHNILQAFISFGESSVLGLGNHPFGEGWKVSIPDIYSQESLFVFHLKNNSLSVSGNTPANMNKYHQGHIINPFTGVYESNPGIICVSGPSTFQAEILSTALFIAGEKEQIQILKNFSGFEAVRISYAAKSKTPVIKEILLS